jgi:hypothetical protein
MRSAVNTYKMQYEYLRDNTDFDLTDYITPDEMLDLVFNDNKSTMKVETKVSGVTPPSQSVSITPRTGGVGV